MHVTLFYTYCSQKELNRRTNGIFNALILVSGDISHQNTYTYTSHRGFTNGKLNLAAAADDRLNISY